MVGVLPGTQEGEGNDADAGSGSKAGSSSACCSVIVTDGPQRRYYNHGMLFQLLTMLSMKSRRARAMVPAVFQLAAARSSQHSPRPDGTVAAHILRDQFLQLLHEQASPTLVDLPWRSIALALSLLDEEQGVIIMLCGTSGTGKSTLASLLGQRLAIPTVVSTDSLRNMLRGFIDEESDPILHASSYEAASVLPARTPALEGLPSSKLAKMGYKAQCTTVFAQVERLVQMWHGSGRSAILEGVHLSLKMVKRLADKFPSVVPFLVYIKNEHKHMERMSVRAKYMSLEPSRNKYVQNMQGIVAIQNYLVASADKLGVPKVNNTNVDASVALIHKTVMGTLTRCCKSSEAPCKPLEVLLEEFRGARAHQKKARADMKQLRSTIEHMVSVAGVHVTPATSTTVPALTARALPAVLDPLDTNAARQLAESAQGGCSSAVVAGVTEARCSHGTPAANGFTPGPGAMVHGSHEVEVVGRSAAGQPSSGAREASCRDNGAVHHAHVQPGDEQHRHASAHGSGSGSDKADTSLKMDGNADVDTSEDEDEHTSAVTHTRDSHEDDSDIDQPAVLTSVLSHTEVGSLCDSADDDDERLRGLWTWLLPDERPWASVDEPLRSAKLLLALADAIDVLQQGSTLRLNPLGLPASLRLAPRRSAVGPTPFQGSEENLMVPASTSPNLPVPISAPSASVPVPDTCDDEAGIQEDQPTTPKLQDTGSHVNSRNALWHVRPGSHSSAATSTTSAQTHAALPRAVPGEDAAAWPFPPAPPPMAPGVAPAAATVPAGGAAAPPLSVAAWASRRGQPRRPVRPRRTLSMPMLIPLDGILQEIEAAIPHADKETAPYLQHVHGYFKRSVGSRPGRWLSAAEDVTRCGLALDAVREVEPGAAVHVSEAGYSARGPGHPVQDSRAHLAEAAVNDGEAEWRAPLQRASSAELDAGHSAIRSVVVRGRVAAIPGRGVVGTGPGHAACSARHLDSGAVQSGAHQMDVHAVRSCDWHGAYPRATHGGEAAYRSRSGPNVGTRDIDNSSLLRAQLLIDGAAVQSGSPKVRGEMRGMLRAMDRTRAPHDLDAVGWGRYGRLNLDSSQLASMPGGYGLQGEGDEGLWIRDTESSAMVSEPLPEGDCAIDAELLPDALEKQPSGMSGSSLDRLVVPSGASPRASRASSVADEAAAGSGLYSSQQGEHRSTHPERVLQDPGYLQGTLHTLLFRIVKLFRPQRPRREPAL